eukprot:scaffold1483_cov153-Skeletonema_menzelii.AAC.12
MEVCKYDAIACEVFFPQILHFPANFTDFPPQELDLLAPNKYNGPPRSQCITTSNEGINKTHDIERQLN